MHSLIHFYRRILRHSQRSAAIVAAAIVLFLPSTALPQGARQTSLAVFPSGKEGDVKFYNVDGGVLTGVKALEQMKGANLSLWIAGNQFFAMDEVIGSFLRSHPGLTVGLITLPPGLILSAISSGGWTFEGRAFEGTPDIYASVNLGHLKQLKAAGLMSDYAVYMHNELQIMVAKGNPKGIVGIDDLARSDVRTSMPNPVNEGIMQFYARRVLEKHGIWSKISGGQECLSCQSTDNNWFTAVHHRETPERILAGKSDAGIVWKTEVIEAVRAGSAVDAVELPPNDSLRQEVSYVIGALTNSEHKSIAQKYLAFLATETAQSAYANFGFVRATPEELRLKSID